MLDYRVVTSPLSALSRPARPAPLQLDFVWPSQAAPRALPKAPPADDRLPALGRVRGTVRRTP